MPNFQGTIEEICPWHIYLSYACDLNGTPFIPNTVTSQRIKDFFDARKHYEIGSFRGDCLTWENIKAKRRAK